MKLKITIALISLTTLVNCAPATPSEEAATAPAFPMAVAQSLEQSSANACASAKSSLASASSLNSGATVNAPIVNGLYKGTNVTALRDSQGNFTFIGTSANAKIELMSNFDGNITICDASVGVVSEVRANLFIVNGSLQSLDGFEGNAVIVNGQGPVAIQDSFGNLIVRDTSGQLTGSFLRR